MLLIVDANVLIDYANSDPGVLKLVTSHIAPIHVPAVVLDEVEQLSLEDCSDLGILVIEEPLDLLLAAAEKRGALSFEDHVCLLLAKQRAWTCVSNDKPLHRACTDEEAPVMWGLRLMVELVEAEQLSKEEALDIAEAIRQSNPRHITAEIIEEFKKKTGF
jgi:hypothetical protein